MPIKTPRDAQSFLTFRGQEVRALTGIKDHYLVNGERVSKEHLLILARHLEQSEGRQNKYNAEPTWIEGQRFASKAEAHRYAELLVLEEQGVISQLELQPRFEILHEFRDFTGRRHPATFYVADFQYVEDGRPMVEDVKGMITPVYRLKRKFFLAQYGHLRFKETKAK